ncbi:MAG TPA: AbrB/MazE/SpoVT family DNA-binding domain-containing protein [Acidobacteriota bacterium]|nr:AbrB/MazE/SpoVT family DNA-binding domain-containing protein [Acidobacteriota bacterium]
MDSSGRLVIPKVIRQRAGFTSGMELEVRCHDGRVELEAAPRRVRIVKRGELYVAVPGEPTEPLTAETVRRTQEVIRRRDAQD